MGFCAVDVTVTTAAAAASIAASDVVVYHMFCDITHTVCIWHSTTKKNSVRLLSKIFMQSFSPSKNKRKEE